MSSVPFYSEESIYERNGGYYDKLFTPENCWEGIERFDSRATDVWVLSFGRSGSHWLRRIVDLILGNEDTDPLLVPNFAINMSAIMGPDTPVCMGYELYAAQPPDTGLNRVISSHLPVDLLPKSVLETKGVKIVYIMRNPLDVYKSSFEYNKSILSAEMDFSMFVEFMTKFGLFGGWCANVRGYWERRDDDNVHIIHYEDLVRDFKAVATKLAMFLDRPLSDDQLDNIQERSSLQVMKSNETPMEPGNFKYTFGRIVHKGAIRGASEFSERDVALVRSHMQEKLAGTSIRYLQEIMKM